MGEFEAGAYVGEDRRIYRSDQTPDTMGRWVDDLGYIRLGGESDDHFEDYWYIDSGGELRDVNGASQGITLPVHDSVRVEDHEPGRAVGENDVLWQGPSGNVHLSDRVIDHDDDASQQRRQAVSDLVDAIPKTRGVDAAGNDLTWAGTEKDPETGQMHGRSLGTEFAGEDTETTAFRAGTLRANQGPGDQWTTEYGTSDPTTVHKGVNTASVDDAGLLVGPDGAPLTGTFGFVVDPNDGSLYTFTEGEMWASLGGGWVNLTGQPVAMLTQALAAGQQIRAVHHSSALRGAPAAGAGKITVTNGTITQIDNESGHYKPEAEYIWQTIEWLALQGMDVDKINVRIVATDRDAEKTLKAWKLSLGQGNATQVDTKDRAMAELERNATISRLVPGSLQQKHYQATRSCLSLNVGGTSGSLYCMGGCDADLPQEYLPLLNTGPAQYS